MKTTTCCLLMTDSYKLVEEFHGQLKIGGGKKRVLLDWRENERRRRSEPSVQSGKNLEMAYVKNRKRSYSRNELCAPNLICTFLISLIYISSK